MADTRVSVIIPTFNSAGTLEKCLASIKANKTRYPYEIIVVDCGSTDATLDIAGKYGAIILKDQPKRINRNIGVQSATGDIICFTDSDCTVPTDWIDKLVGGLLRLHGDDKQVVGVGGGNLPWLENPSLEELAIARVLHSPFVSFKARNTAIYNKVRLVNHNPPLNSCLLKEAILEVGGFEESPGYGYGEDSALDATLIQRGYKLYYLPDVFILHKHPPNAARFARQMYAYGWGRVKLGQKYKGYFGLHHYGPVLLCLMTFSPLVFLPAAMAAANALCVSLSEKEARLLSPVMRLTMTFYVKYGWGEIVALRGKPQ